MGIYTPINKKDLKELMKETNECLADDVSLCSGQRVFGSIDLWNAHKKHRTSSSMRRWHN